MDLPVGDKYHWPTHCNCTVVPEYHWSTNCNSTVVPVVPISTGYRHRIVCAVAYRMKLKEQQCGSWNKWVCTPCLFSCVFFSNFIFSVASYPPIYISATFLLLCSVYFSYLFLRFFYTKTICQFQIRRRRE